MKQRDLTLFLCEKQKFWIPRSRLRIALTYSIAVHQLIDYDVENSGGNHSVHSVHPTCQRLVRRERHTLLFKLQQHSRHLVD